MAFSPFSLVELESLLQQQRASLTLNSTLSPSGQGLPEPNEGIEILVEMAQSGVIDPWNVDLAAVAEQYLNAISEELGDPEDSVTTPQPLSLLGRARRVAEKARQPKESVGSSGEVVQLNLLKSQSRMRLRKTGKTLLYLAILLRMKSDLLAGEDPFATEDGMAIEEASFDDLVTYDEWGNPIASTETMARQQAALEQLGQSLRQRYGTLETVLSRRTSTKQKRIRPVTLDDLIRELKRVEGLQQERSAQDKLKRLEQRRRIRDFSNLSTEDITELAHDEFQEAYVAQVLALIQESLPPASNEEPDPRLAFSDLVEAASLPPTVCFLSLLFLEARDAIELRQDTFYGEEAWIHWPAPIVSE